MNGCAHCVALQRQVRELQEELAEWRLRERAEAAVSDVRASDLTRRLVRALKVDTKYFGPAEFRLLFALIEASPAICTRERLFSVICLEPESDVGLEIVKVRVSRLRRMLREAGVDAVIETYWGQGYRLTTGAAATVKAWLDGLVAS